MGRYREPKKIPTEIDKYQSGPLGATMDENTPQVLSSSQGTAPGKKGLAPALSRGLKVLELIAKAEGGLSLTAISKKMGIAMSSAHSMCTTLKYEGYIDKQSDGTYFLTLKILDIASSKINNYDIVEHFYDSCDQMPLIRENGVVLSILDGADVFYIGCRNSIQPLGVTFRVGMRLPACCTASGRALLSARTDEEIIQLYPDEIIPQISQSNTKTRTELLRIIHIARARGYSDEKAGTRPHMYSWGAVVPCQKGRPIAAVAVSLYEGDVVNGVEARAIASIKKLASRLARFGELMT